MIRVLVVEDSPVVREFLVHILSSEPEIRVVATASNGEEALEEVERVKPDVVTMDIHMPKMNGLEASRRIMQTHPTPIVIVSGTSNLREATKTFHAMEAGALAVVPRPEGIGHPNHRQEAAQLIQTVKLMSEVKVVRRWARPPRGSAAAPVLPPREVAPRPLPNEVQVVAIGASTGGPLVLQTIFADLPRDFSVPILVVQHMAAGFIAGFVEWIAQTSSLPVSVARHGEPLLPGHAYLAPDGFQMKVGMGGRVLLTADQPENGLRPSVSSLFRSVAEIYGRRAIGILLTGMGKDGAEELRVMKEKGAITIAQDKESSVVHGMPGEAINLDAATYVLPPGRIAEVLAKFTSQKAE
jgi:two-component system chemotaxis response regulator CheB